MLKSQKTNNYNPPQIPYIIYFAEMYDIHIK